MDVVHDKAANSYPVQLRLKRGLKGGIVKHVVVHPSAGIAASRGVPLYKTTVRDEAAWSSMTMTRR